MQLSDQSLARSTALLAALMWALAMAASGAFYVMHEKNAIRENQTQLQVLLKESTRSIKARVNMYALGSTALRAGLLSDDDSTVKPPKVRSFIKHRNTEKEFAGSRGFGFIRPMTQAQVPDYMALNMNDPEYPKTVVSLADQTDHSGEVYLIEAIEPVTKNKAALGLDIASEPNRKLAATSSAATGTATLTAPLNLTQVNDPNTVGFLLLTPVYKDGVPLNSPEERSKHLIGWTYSAFLIEELLATAQLHTEMMGLNIVDISDPNSPRKVFTNSESNTDAQNALSVTTNIDLFGRTWQVNAVPTESMTSTFSRRTIHWAEMLIFAFLLSAACIGLFFFMKWKLMREQHRKDDLKRLEALVEERTRELYKAERKTKKILDTVPLLIGYWDTNLRNVFANHAYEDWFGISRHQLPGISLSELLPPAAYQKSLPRTQEVLRGIPQKFMNKFPDLNGNGERYGMVDMLPDEIDGNIVGFFVCMLDVTELQKAREAAFASSAAKSRFMATIAHEIRNPLNGVLGSASILMDELPDGDMKSSIAEIKDSAKSMRVILDDLLDMTAFESGHLSLEKIPFDLHEVMTNTTSLHQTIAHKKKVQFELRFEPESHELRLIGDPTRFKQIIQNLISNAVKFTSAGQISCHVKIARTDLERCIVQIKVKDTGIGIPANKLATLFTPFVQADTSNFREFGGSGLGLSITKSLVEAMGGDITVHSQVGAGTEMEVGIPFQLDALDTRPVPHPAHQPTNETTTLEQQNLNCLVIDDMALNRKIFKHILQRDGHAVDLADSGHSALKLCKNKLYDLIISDIDMPGMNGYEFTETLRKNIKCMNQKTPIIACSGFATLSDIRKALSHGMNGHIAKPLDPDTVRVEISRWMNRFNTDAPAPSQPLGV